MAKLVVVEINPRRGMRHLRQLPAKTVTHQTPDPMQTDPIKAALDYYVSAKHIPGYSCLVSRNGEELVYLENGFSDAEAGKMVSRDTIFRIYSMTKPLTSVAMMQLYEQGLFKLDDPVHHYIPEWKDLMVFESGNADNYEVVAPQRPMAVLDLFTHTSGLTYDFMHSHPVDELYRRHHITGAAHHIDAGAKVKTIAGLPLQFSPGSRWNYSVSTDALGYLVELLSGQPLDTYIKEHITGPLGMVDTAFHIVDSQLSRFAACYQANPQTGEYVLQESPGSSRFRQRPVFLSGGGGMVSTINDYHRFCQLMLNKGSLDDTQLLQPHTVELMTRNHLPDNQDLAAMGQSVFTETPLDSMGFGLGFSVVLDGGSTKVMANTGEFAWGGLASTYFWVDPVEQLIVIFMTQLIPSDAFPIRPQLREAVYLAIKPEAGT